MPNKKKKFNARFPPARIKKIMQKDEEVGKVAAAVPVLISKALEHFIQGLLIKASEQTLEKNAKTLTTSHIKQCINREKVFDFLQDLVVDIPDLQNEKDSSTQSNSGQHGQQKKHRVGRGKKRKVQEDLPSESSSDEDSSDNNNEQEEEKDEREDDGENVSGRRTSKNPSGNPSYDRNHTQGARSGTELTQDADRPGPSSAAPKFKVPSVNIPGNFGYPVQMGQYTPRNVPTEQTPEDDEDYDT